MRVKNWLLAGTGLGMLAFTTAPALAQSNEDVIRGYQLYINARNAGDAGNLKTYEDAFGELCTMMNFSLDDCVRAVESGMFGPIDGAQAVPPPAQPAPVEAPPTPPQAQPAPVEVPPVQPPQPDPMAELQNRLNAELSNYQIALDLAAAGDFANAQPMADSAANNILNLCINAGYPSIEACIGQSLPPLASPPPAQPPPVEPVPVEVPPAQPAPVAPPPQTANPMEQLRVELLRQVEIYGGALAAVEQGDASQYRAARNAFVEIQNICASAGFGDYNGCLGQFGYAIQPLPAPPTVTDAPVVRPTEAPPVAVIPDQLLDQDVTPDAIETLPPDILPQDAAPLLDSIKDALGLGQQPFEMPSEPALPPPTSDADAQTFAPIELPPVTAETGRAIEAPIQLGIQQIPDGRVTQQQSGGFVIELNTGLYFENPEQERDRIWDASEDEIFYEQLSRGRIKETIVRPNGVQIVTIRDRNGDVLRRSRITPDGREYVLAYYDEEEGDFTEYRDPGQDLPPLVLNIPARDYVLDARDADEGDVADFFSQPPVEQVRRIYSIEEVKRSARIRDSVRRLEIGGLTFDSGKATISRSQVGALSNVANAMLELLDRNPAETFLIEGHTDAVGSEISNLALSDLRASTIARILTDFYGIPPENLVTQGYGERYLKVRTLEAERLNRRVTVRRITPLITLASN